MNETVATWLQSALNELDEFELDKAEAEELYQKKRIELEREHALRQIAIGARRAEFIVKFKRDLHKQMLYPGQDTKTIIDLVECLRQFDEAVEAQDAADG